MIKVFIADDHFFVREGLRKVIESELDIEVVGEAGSGGEVFDGVKKSACDVALLDISLPDRDGLELLKDIKAAGLNCKIVFLTMHPERIYAERAFKLGAWGYITKESNPEDVIFAIYQVASGKKYITPGFAAIIADKIGADSRKKQHELLSEREYQIFLMIASGKTIREISEDLSISQSTVNTYKQRVFEKMNLHSNFEIVFYALRNKLIAI